MKEKHIVVDGHEMLPSNIANISREEFIKSHSRLDEKQSGSMYDEAVRVHQENVKPVKDATNRK